MKSEPAVLANAYRKSEPAVQANAYRKIKSWRVVHDVPCLFLSNKLDASILGLNIKDYFVLVYRDGAEQLLVVYILQCFSNLSALSHSSTIYLVYLWVHLA